MWDTKLYKAELKGIDIGAPPGVCGLNSIKKDIEIHLVVPEKNSITYACTKNVCI